VRARVAAVAGVALSSAVTVVVVLTLEHRWGDTAGAEIGLGTALGVRTIDVLHAFGTAPFVQANVVAGTVGGVDAGQAPLVDAEQIVAGPRTEHARKELQQSAPSAPVR